jgi:RNA polymerase sigma-70 factor (ECF subfamily)
MAIVLPAGPTKPAEPATRDDDSAKVDEVYATYRPLLFSIAYRMTGSAAEAEDIVQDAFLRYHTTPGLQIRSPRAFLSTIVTRLSLDRLKSARHAREHYVGSWLPEPVLTASTGLSDGSTRPRLGVEPAAEPLETVEQRESISLAFLLLLESLTPEERAVFVLHEAFDYPYDEIAGILGKTPAACRQLLHRARARIAERRPRFQVSPSEQRRLVERFIAACERGDVPALADVLAQDVVSWADGGGKVRAALQPIVGREKVIRFLLAILRLAPADYAVRVEEVNGAPAIVVWSAGAVLATFTFDVADGQLHALRLVVNPDKLAFLQRQLQTAPPSVT